jgi:nitrogen-specific signal transduction histidine kinase
VELKSRVGVPGVEAEESAWAATTAISIHGEVMNALAGVRGQIRLLLADPAASDPGFRRRLEVALGETQRIENAMARLRLVEARLHAAADPDSRAA